MNPYEAMPESAFWRLAVANRDPLQIDQLWHPKARFRLTKRTRVATAGSCFAQHIGRALAARGYNWFDAEPAPLGMSDEIKKTYNYGVFSFRTGNIYTTALLRQWVSWALGHSAPPDELWIAGDRFLDPFRPTIEPSGYASREEVLLSRETTLRAIRRCIADCKVFVFTLGLTEGWRNVDGYEYPMCPGTAGGEFNPDRHVFVNYSYPEIRNDLSATMKMMKALNPRIRFLLTVSPVPLTATASQEHVLVATTYSKSTLRAVAGDMRVARRDTEYFPSYEIITSFPYRGAFFEPNLRSVSAEGVGHVMNTFFACLGDDAPSLVTSAPSLPREEASESDLVCDEEMLDAAR